MKFMKGLLAAVIATGVMTGFMLLAPFVGLPKMNVGVLLGTMFGRSEVVGWVLHVVIGVVMMIPYVLFFNRWLPVENKIARGTIYGIVVFVFSEIMFSAINIAGHLNNIDRENMALMVFGNALACMIYGSVLGAFFEREGKDGLEDAKGNA